MNKFIPNPMPEEVLRAYRKYTQLCPLLLSVVFTDRERADVRDKFLEELIKKHADAEVFVGDKGRTQKVSARVKSFRKNVVSAVEFLLDVEDFGGREHTMPMLAAVMQPYWARWWDSFEISPSRYSDHTKARISAMLCVLGNRQMLWIAAQYVRRLFFFLRQDSDDARLLVSAAKQMEYTAANPTEIITNFVHTWYVVERARSVFSNGNSGLSSALWSANAGLEAENMERLRNYTTNKPSDDIKYRGMSSMQFLVYITNCISASRSSTSDQYELDVPDPVLDDIRKQLITPTLIIAPSR